MSTCQHVNMSTCQHVTRAKFVREVYTSMETEFSLVGVTGIEDRLQDEVVETLADLRTANIKVDTVTK